jgi:hypothetical protein
VQSITAGGSGFGLGFFVVPTLFNNWGPFAPAAGFMWFGLLFFAAITSSLAMGQPVMAFLQQEYGLNRQRSALAFGGVVLALALPVALLHSNSFFDEFDYWAGTVMLVVFALVETVLFAWVFGMHRAWGEITRGAELWVPRIFYFITKFVTPVFLTLILAAYVFKPAAEWRPYLEELTGGEPAPAWRWAGDGLIGKLMHYDLDDRAEAIRQNAQLSAEKKAEGLAFLERLKTTRNIDRLVMVGLFVLFAILVKIAWNRRRREGRN